MYGDVALLRDLLSSADSLLLPLVCASCFALLRRRLRVHFTSGNIFSNDTECGVLNAEKPQDFGNVGMRQGDRGKKMFPKLERVVLAVPFGKEQVFEGDAERAFSVSMSRIERAERPARIQRGGE